MPLIKRSVEPVELSRAHVGQGIRNELECVTNSTLSNVIRQLSSLSKHAEDMFGELFHEANTVFHRANNLQDRVEKLKVKVTQLDSTQDVVSLQDINNRKPFKSSVIREQQIISKRSRPASIHDTYLNCDAPPALSKLNIYREDGKDSIKFYTDPTYFFELWCQEMQKDTAKQQKRIRHKHHHPHHNQHSDIEDYDTYRKRHQQTYTPSPKPTEKHRGSLLSRAHTIQCVRQFVRPKQNHKVQIKEITPIRDKYRNKAMGKEFEPVSDYSSRSINYAQDHYEGGRRVDRPNSLEGLPKHGEYVKPNQHMTGGSTDLQRSSSMQQHPQHPHQQQEEYHNGPINRLTQNDPRQYDANTMYQQQQQQQANTHQQQQQQQQYQYDKFDSNSAGSPYGTPNRVHSIVSPGAGRPMSRPPPPPSDMGSKTTSRESLPPPPPPPPPMDIINPSYPMSGAGGTGSPLHHHSFIEDIRRSPAKSIDSHGSSSAHSGLYGGSNQSREGTPNSLTGDLPPPPPSPPTSGGPGTPNSITSIPPPPPPPPPPMMGGGYEGGMPMGMMGGAPPPTPPGPPPLTGTHQMNGQAVAGGLVPSTEEEPEDDARSDLLDAIRTGINLRKVEQKEQKEKQRRNTAGHLDVQAIMEAAFEMRRQAMERDSDEEVEEEDEDDNEWSDEDA